MLSATEKDGSLLLWELEWDEQWVLSGQTKQQKLTIQTWALASDESWVLVLEAAMAGQVLLWALG